MSNDTQPEIRFPGFTEDWEQRKLGDLGSVAMNKRIFKDQTSDNGEVPFFKIGTFGSHPDAFISRELFEEYKSKYPYPEVGDILISASGSIGRTVVYQGEDEYFQDSNIVWLKHNGRLDNKFLQQFYSIVKWQGLEGSTIKRLYNKNILDTNISVPTLDEQNKLGAFFEQLDDTIALHQRKLDLLKETKKGFLQKMFPKNGAKVPEIRFPGFTKDWEERKVGEIFKVTRGQVLAATETSESITEKNIYPVYSSQTKNDGLMGYYSDYLFDTAITWTTDGANAGTVNYRNGKFYSTNVNGVLLSDKGYANKAVAEIINRIAWKHVSKVGNPKLMNNVMSEITITIPSVEEQETISRFFTQLDSTITLHERELDLLKETKKGFLQKMFV
ncbi:restriction endonuclease subunit S [Enterococcus faecium]|nr:restriction endonuclease subunit S [Enterococcus faecium]